MKLFLIGDTHGDFAWMQSKVRKHAQRAEADAIIQMGDFGFIWRQERDEVERRLDNLNKVFANIGIPLYWLDGNHENFDRLAELGIDTTADHFIEVRSHIIYMPRGCTWEWDGLRFMSLGGAYSIDNSRRTLFVDWWPQETITAGDVERALTRGEGGIDVLFSHDSPDHPTLSEFLNSFNLPYKLEEQSRANRNCVNAVVDYLKPKLVVHGHYHERIMGHHQETAVLGLNHSKHGAQAWALLDTSVPLDDQIEW